MNSSDFLFLFGASADSDCIHSGETEQVKIAALELSQPRSGSSLICCDQCGNGSKPILHFALDRTHADLTGIHTCTAMNSLF
eukprot:SAG11_NODE_556_length_8552_cov_8.500651_4_plen_82_part_00